MTRPHAACAGPGEFETLTGGYIHDRRLLTERRRQGRDVAHIRLAGSFPDPTPPDPTPVVMADAAERSARVAPDCAVLIDGPAMGAMDKSVPAAVSAPIVALVHHPLAPESGLAPATRAHLSRTERADLGLAAPVAVPSPHIAALPVSDDADPPGRGATPAPPLIASVGILVPRRGHGVLIRALARLRDRCWQAVIAQPALDADHAALLARLVADHGLSGRVRLAGRVSGEELARLHGQASVFALATRYEGHGIGFEEAMAKTSAVAGAILPGWAAAARRVGAVFDKAAAHG